MSKNNLKTIKIILAVIFAVSVGMLIYNYVQSSNAQQAYEDAKDMAQKTDEEDKPQTEDIKDEPKVWKPAEITGDSNMTDLTSVDLAPLREVNDEVVGWIRIPGTVVDYPVLKGVDNDYYLEHTWDNKKSIAGAIFIEHYSDADFSDLNTIIYGHHMNDDSMFGSLLNYKKQEYFDEHPYIYILDDNGVRRYEIFAAYEAPVRSKTYQVGFASDESRQAFLDECAANSVIETGVTPTLNDKVITLSTCTNVSYATRWVVQACVIGE